MSEFLNEVAALIPRRHIENKHVPVEETGIDNGLAGIRIIVLVHAAVLDYVFTEKINRFFAKLPGPLGEAITE